MNEKVPLWGSQAGQLHKHVAQERWVFSRLREAKKQPRFRLRYVHKDQHTP